MHEDLVTLELKLKYCKCYAQSDVSLLDCIMVEYVYNWGPLIHGTDRTGPDRIHTLFYGTDRTMNAEFRRMRQVRHHVGMEVFVMAVLDLG